MKNEMETFLPFEGAMDTQRLGLYEMEMKWILGLLIAGHRGWGGG